MTDETDKVTADRTAPEDLHVSEIRYRRLFESARDGILILDAASRRVTDVNPFMVELMGYSRDEFLGKELWEIGLFKDKDDSQLAFRELQTTGYIRYEDLPLQTKAGKQWDVEFICSVYPENNQQVIQCSIRDITERKRAEAAKFLLAAIVESSEDSIVSIDFEKTITTWNKGAERLYGYPAGEALGKPLTMLTLPRDLEEVMSNIDKIRRGETVEPFETERRQKDGPHLFLAVVLSPVKDEAGRIVGVSTVARDITERKQAEEESVKLNKQLEQRVSEGTVELMEVNGSLQAEIVERRRAEIALRSSEQYFRALTECSSDIICVLDGNGIIRYSCPSVERVLGYKAEELIGKSFFKTLHPDDVSDLTCFFGQDLHNPNNYVPKEFRHLHKDGAWRIMEATCRNLLHDPVVAGIVINSRDITERKLAEEQVRESQAQLRGLSAHLQTIREEERTHLAREIHDELGQSLTALKIDLSWLNKELLERNDDSAPQLLKKIKSMSELIDSTIRSVRKISTELRPGVLDFFGLVAAVEWQAGEFQARTGVNCHCKLPAKEIDLEHGRSVAVFRIFQEILTNVARHANATSVEVCIKEEAGVLILKVRDDGRGITGSEINDNHSLGLIGMRERALLLGGEFTITGVESGSTIIVRIPVTDRRQSKREIG